MPPQDSPDVTFASADPALLACWEEKVKQGASCSLLLEHKKGVITTTLKCGSTRKAFNAEGNRKKLKALPSYQERLVREKGLPPSNLMLQTVSKFLWMLLRKISLTVACVISSQHQSLVLTFIRVLSISGQNKKSLKLSAVILPVYLLT